MKELKLRGFVTPADCGGNVAKALQLAKALELNKVVLTGDVSWAEPLVLTSGMYLVLENCHLQADLVTPMEENFSFRQKFITIEGENSSITGNIHIFNTHHLNISGLKIAGNLTCEYTLWGNIHHLDMGTLLDRLGIAVRTGHHCAEPLMRRLGIEGTCRASFALYNTREEVDALVEGIRRVSQMF